MERRDLSAAGWLTSRLTALALAAVGLWFATRPDALGWGAAVRLCGSEGALLAVGVGCAFFVAAALAYEKDRLRLHAAETLEALHELLYGRDYRREREAIGVLVGALESSSDEARDAAYRHLVRLTGQNFACDARVWAAWWAVHERRWSRARSDAAREGPSDPEAP